MKPTVRIIVALDTDLYKKLETEMKRQGVGYTAVTRKALEVYLEHQPKGNT